MSVKPNPVDESFRRGAAQETAQELLADVVEDLIRDEMSRYEYNRMPFGEGVRTAAGLVKERVRRKLLTLLR